MLASGLREADASFALGLGALGETEVYLQDKVLSSVSFEENVTFGISGVTHLGLTLIKKRCYGQNMKVLLQDCHTYHFGQVLRKICQMYRCLDISYSVYLCYRMPIGCALSHRGS